MSLVFWFGLTNDVILLQVQVKTLKKNHPAVVMVATFCLGWFLVYQFGCILVFLSGVILPVLFIIVHASLRLRNAKNKVVCPFIIVCVVIILILILMILMILIILNIEYDDNFLGKCCQGSILEENWKRESG